MHSLRHSKAFVLVLILSAAILPSLEVHAISPDEDLTVQVYKKLALATVFITSSYLTNERNPSGPAGIGSGILLDQTGAILTNAHVVQGAAKITVMLHDNTRLPAELVGLDPVTDVALLKIALPKKHPAPAQLGDSDNLEIGQKVLAIGHPFGLGYALTTGVISGFGSTPDTGTGEVLHDRVIQTSAAINPGNSGGPLVDLDGHVVGINSAMLLGAQNIGFAIPINTVKQVLGELQSHGRVVRPWLGFIGKVVTDELMQLFCLPLRHGVLVQDIAPRSPADRAGLQAGKLNITIEGEPWVFGGDIIQSIDGQGVKTPAEFTKVIHKLKVGQVVELSIIRGGAFLTIRAALEERPGPSSSGTSPAVQPKIELRPL
jgi:S1-C subfamily serine protease